MRADGTAASKEAADGTGGASTFMSLTRHNSEASGFSSGDIIVLHDDAGAFTGTMDLQYSDGCTYQAYTGDSPKIENAGTCVSFGEASNVTWDGIDCEKTSSYAYMVIGAVDPGNNGTIKNCDISGADAYGIRLGDISATNYYSGWVIEDNVLHGNVVAGVNVMFRGSGCIIRRNEVYGNCTANGNYGGGIKLYGHTTDISGMQVYDNYVHDNGLPAGTGNQGDGVGIWFDACLGASDDLNLIYNNLIVDNGGMGIFIEISSYCYVYSNVCIGNGFNSSGGNEFTPAHICVDSRTDGSTPFVSEHNRVYNNSCYGGRGGLKCVAYNQTADWTHLTDNIFKNNIVSGTDDEALICMGGGDNLTYGTGMVYDNNCLGAEATNFIFWGYGTHYSTYDAWETAHGESWTQIEGDPLYTDPANGDLTLQSGSPCVGAGENLGSPFDNGLLTTSTWPDGVVTGDRDSY
jgi:parallel beta-helix repeat protein